MTGLGAISVGCLCTALGLALLKNAQSQEINNRDFRPAHNLEESNSDSPVEFAPISELENFSKFEYEFNQVKRPAHSEPANLPIAPNRIPNPSIEGLPQASLTPFARESALESGHSPRPIVGLVSEAPKPAKDGWSLPAKKTAETFPSEFQPSREPSHSSLLNENEVFIDSGNNNREFSDAVGKTRLVESPPFEDLTDDGPCLDAPTDDTQLIWWSQQVAQGLIPDNASERIDLNSLVYQAIKNSPRIQAISQTPLIRELQVIEADSAFDAFGFVRSNFNDRNDPVGNVLVTGSPLLPFLEDHIWTSDFGVKRKTRTGADVELGQKLGFQNSNSRFFAPQDQGTATLALNVSQPLLRGRGKFVNESQILIAQANTGAAWSAFSNELQDELEKVAQAYWQLHYDRSLYLQKKRNVERGQQIQDILQARQDLDSMPSQVARARSAVELRKTQLANALRDIRNSETEIRRRIADRDWMTAQTIELIPEEPAQTDSTKIPLEQVVYTALENRPEIKEAMQRAKVAGIQNQIGENELLPELSLLVGGYVSALNGESGVLNSWSDQFSNTPGYNAGINFEMPYGNRAARSRLSQQKLQLAKIKAEVEESIQQVIAESQVAHRRVVSAVQTRASAIVSIEASREDLSQQSSRWEQFGLVEGDFSEGQNPVTLLNQVLDAQERLAVAELIYAQADLELRVSEINLQRSMGTLLMYQNINFSTSAERELPQLQIDQFNPANGK
jgi:outer membrane protein TolC